MRRISDVTGLNLNEDKIPVQVSNYGIGGHYEPHYDFCKVILIDKDIISTFCIV